MRTDAVTASDFRQAGTAASPRVLRVPLLILCGLLCSVFSGGCQHVTIGIAYGNEKQEFLEWARGEFRKTPGGDAIDIDLIPMGSVESANQIVAGLRKPETQRINVWAPASHYYREDFEAAWARELGTRPPIVFARSLFDSPLVLLFWRNRLQVLKNSGASVTLTRLAQAMHERRGWGAINPEYASWGLVNIGISDPTRSNSGLMALTLLCYESIQGSRLQMSDFADPKFVASLDMFIECLRGSPSSRTGDLLREFLKHRTGWFDGIVIYENLALEAIRSLPANREEELAIEPLALNIRNDHPFCILDVPWSSDAQRDAARKFFDFLMTPAAQEKAASLGFRPALHGVPGPQNLPDLPISHFCDAPDPGVFKRIQEEYEQISRRQ